jgi:hypothetical protein
MQGLVLYFLREKIFRGMRNRGKFLFILSEFRLFCGMENSRNSIPSQSAEHKKAWNSVLNDLLEEKNTQNFILIISFRSAENARNSFSNHFAGEKNTWNFVPNH